MFTIIWQTNYPIQFQGKREHHLDLHGLVFEDKAAARAWLVEALEYVDGGEEHGAK